MDSYEIGVGKLSVPPAPLLGGGIILYAEMLAVGRYPWVEIELEFGESTQASSPAVASSIGALSALDKVKKVAVADDASVGARSSDESRDRMNKTSYVSSSPILDSPASLLDFDKENLLELVRFKSEVAERASVAVEGGKRPILCVHANSVRRPSPEEKARSLGDEDEWLEGLRAAIDHGFDMLILFIGSDAKRLSERLGRPESTVPPVGDFSTQLACIHLAEAFLAMSSGPATVAMFSTTPYVVFKHPSHHPSQMEILLKGDKYPFSLFSQRVLRRYPDRKAVEEACFSLAGHGT